MSNDLTKLRTALRLLREIDVDRLHKTMCGARKPILDAHLGGTRLWQHVDGVHAVSVWVSQMRSDLKDEIDGVMLNLSEDEIEQYKNVLTGGSHER